MDRKLAGSAPRRRFSRLRVVALEAMESRSPVSSMALSALALPAVAAVSASATLRPSAEERPDAAPAEVQAPRTARPTPRAAVGSGTPVAPSLYLTKVVASPGQPAFLGVSAQNTQVMSLPGANIITANGTANPIDWIVDAGTLTFQNTFASAIALDRVQITPASTSSVLGSRSPRGT